MKVSTKNNAEGKVSSVNEEVCGNQGSKGNEETTAVGDPGWKEHLSCVNMLKKWEKEQGPARVKAPPQKGRAVIRVDSAGDEG